MNILKLHFHNHNLRRRNAAATWKISDWGQLDVRLFRRVIIPKGLRLNSERCYFEELLLRSFFFSQKGHYSEDFYPEGSLFRISEQGRSQPHSPGWARVPLSSFISLNFDHVFLLFLKLFSFSSSFWPSEGPGYATVSEQCNGMGECQLDFRSNGQWRSQGLSGWTTRPSGGPKWGRK